MVLTSAVQYAIILIRHIRSNGRPTTISEISDQNELSHPFLEQIAMKLRRNKILKSIRGPGGGFILLKEDINLLDLVSVLTKEKKDKAVQPDMGELTDKINMSLASIKVQ